MLSRVTRISGISSNSITTTTSLFRTRVATRSVSSARLAANPSTPSAAVTTSTTATRIAAMSSSSSNPSSSSAKLQDQDQAQAEGQQQQQPILSPDRVLPAPGQGSADGVTTLDVSGGGSTVRLDSLGPLVVNENGTVSRIGNWAQMTEFERQNTLRILGKRNEARLAALKAKGVGLDMTGQRNETKQTDE